MWLRLGGREKDITADFHAENSKNTGNVLELKSGGEFVGICYVYILHYLNVSNI